MVNNPMLNDANSGWLYLIGDQIFGNVLLLGGNELQPSCSTYASSFSIESADVFFKKTTYNSIKEKFDCIIYDAIDNPVPDFKTLSMINDILSENGVIAIFRRNPTSFRNINKIIYPYVFIKNLITCRLSKIKNKVIPDKVLRSKNVFIQSFSGSVNNVLYGDGYIPTRNPFLLKQKLLNIILGRYLYHIFCSEILNIYYKNEDNNKSVISNVVREVGDKLGLMFDSINYCNIIPYKTLVSVSNDRNERYIFLFLRGTDKNIRANRERVMLEHLGEEFSELSPYISKCISYGLYRNVEYIVYQELIGMTVDVQFSGYDIVENNAFDMLLKLGHMSKEECCIDKNRFEMLVNQWALKLLSNNTVSNSFKEYLYVVTQQLWKVVEGNSYFLTLFHGDYKIENILFNPIDYTVAGIIDWDLSEHKHFPGLDLLYLIIYSRRIKNSLTFKEVCSSVFISEGLSDNEKSMLIKYLNAFNIPDELFNVIIILFIIHHFSFRERNEFSEEWFVTTIDSIWKSKKSIK